MVVIRVGLFAPKAMPLDFRDSLLLDKLNQLKYHDHGIGY